MKNNNRKETDEQYKSRLAESLPRGAVYTAEDIGNTYGEELDALAEAFNLPARKEV